MLCCELSVSTFSSLLYHVILILIIIIMTVPGQERDKSVGRQAVTVQVWGGPEQSSTPVQWPQLVSLLPHHPHHHHRPDPAS